MLSAVNNTDLPNRGDWDQLRDNPLKQNTGKDPKQWNCGGALMTFSSNYIGPKHSQSGGIHYYNSPKSAKLSELTFKKDLVSTGAARLRDKLRNGNVITVFVGHNENLTLKDNVIQQSGNTHFLTLFGCSNDGKKFVFFDPWPSGSKLRYTSGVGGDINSIFRGMLEFHEDEGKFRSPDSVPGSHHYIILDGP